MYTDSGFLDEILKKEDPNAKWASTEHRNKAISVILYNRRIENVETVKQIIAAINKIPPAEINNVTWYDLNQIYGCPRVW